MLIPFQGIADMAPSTTVHLEINSIPNGEDFNRRCAILPFLFAKKPLNDEMSTHSASSSGEAYEPGHWNSPHFCETSPIVPKKRVPLTLNKIIRLRADDATFDKRPRIRTPTQPPNPTQIRYVAKVPVTLQPWKLKETVKIMVAFTSSDCPSKDVQ